MVCHFQLTMDTCNDALKNLPVVDVTKDNFLQMWPSLLHSISAASFIALDVELSGLGNRKALLTKCIDDRYAAIGEIAKTRAIISLGLSCFRHDPPQNTTDSSEKQAEEMTEKNDSKMSESKKNCPWLYQVQTFNITLLCTEDYVVEPGALKFLIEHEFDFNKQYAYGVPYVRGNDKEEAKENAQPSIRKLFQELVHSKQSIVIHNGLVDLIFLYQNLYAPLPTRLSAFIADIDEMFKGGVYDTKYIAEFKLRFHASYLEYIFRKMQRLNASREENNLPCIHVSFPKYGSAMSCVEYRDLSYTKKSGFTQKDICQIYANHGWCPNGNGCTQSHNVGIILDVEELFGSKKRKRKKMNLKKSKFLKAAKENDENHGDLNNQSKDENCSDHDLEENSSLRISEVPVVCDEHCTQSDNKHSSTTTHRASYDAFMTGFIMAAYLTSIKPSPDLSNKFILAAFQDNNELSNRIFLSGKNDPLMIRKSKFASTSKAHVQKTNSP